MSPKECQILHELTAEQARDVYGWSEDVIVELIFPRWNRLPQARTCTVEPSLTRP